MQIHTTPVVSHSAGYMGLNAPAGRLHSFLMTKYINHFKQQVKL